jgi:hypothetical protein
VLNFDGTADASAPNGKRGSLLLDHDSLIISTAANQDLFGQGGFVMSQGSPSYLNNVTLNGLLADSDVEVRTGDEYRGGVFTGIAVEADVTWNTASTLMLKSGDGITINANINGGTGGGLILQSGGKSTTAGTTGLITLAANKTITADTLRLELNPFGSSRPADSVDLGTVNLQGVVNANKVVLAREFGGVQGDVLINNVNNQIGALEGEGATGAITGNLKVRDSAGGLTVSGDLSGVAGAVEILTSGNLTLAAGAQVKNTGASDLVLASRGGSFINQAGASAVDASGSGRFLIYSDAPANTTKGGLVGANLYGRTFDVNAPASITPTGDRFIYSLSPTLTFKADNQTRAVGAANPALTYTVSGVLSGDTLADAVMGTPSVSTTADGSTGVGTVPITIANGSLALTDLGYQLSLQNGVLDITAIPLNPLTITADSFARTYGTFNPVFTATYAGLVGGDTAAVVNGLQFSTSATIQSGVGAYAITPFGASAAGYGITYVPGLLAINPADLVIRVNSFNRFYGSDNPTFTASYSGLVAGDSSAVVSGLALNTAAVKGTGIGEYTITGSGASAANYNLSYVPGKLTIDRAALTITADNLSKTYGAANPALTATFTGLVNNEASSVVSGLSLVTTATATPGVGEYAITASGGSAANYDISYAPGKLTVDPATLTVRADNQVRRYGDANPTFTGTITGFVPGEDASVLTGTPTFGSTADLTTGVGGYAITPSGGSAANYTFVRQNGMLTINPAILAVNADNLVRTYGDANPTLTYTVSGLKNGDTAAGKFFVFLFGSVAAANSAVGNYNILLSGDDTPNDNYSTFFANGTLTVQPRALTIRTDAISREYGLANPSFTATFTGLASFDTPSVIPSLSFSTAATTASGVGDYSVAVNSGNNGNYAITRLPNLMGITPAPLTIAAGSLSRTYGDANPTFTPNIAVGSLRNGDTVAGVNLRIATSATQNSGVGTYDLTGLISSPNYTIVNSVAGSLQILPAILDVIIGNANRIYGDANPSSVSLTATGLKLSDTAAAQVTLSHSATAQSPVGTYGISANGSSANYQLRNVTPGSLQVTAAPLDVTVGNTTRTYGSANPSTASFNVTGFKFGEAAETAIQVTHSATLQSGVGSYAMGASGINPNYFLRTVTPGALQINPAPLSVSLFNADRFYGDANPTPTFETITGLKFGETFASMVSPGNSATLQSGVGSHPFTASSLSPNYQVQSVSGSLRILPAPLHVTAANVVRYYGDPNPANSLQSVVGLKFGETPSSIVTLNSDASLQQLVGTYDILATSLSPNYQISLVDGTMKVNPRPLTLIGNAASKFFGENNPALSYSIGGSGVASFDNAATLLAGVGVSTAVESTSPAGGYPIAITGPTVPNPNYAVTLQPGTLTVNPRPITLDVQSFSRFYYDDTPEIVTTVGGLGLASFQTLADVISWTGKAPAQNADIGIYPLYPRMLNTRDYDITLQGGLATVLPRNLTISVDSIKVDQGQTIPTTFTASVGNLPAGLTVADALPNLTFGTVDDASSFHPAVRPVSSLNDHVVRNLFPAGKISDMVLDADGNILSVPTGLGGLSSLGTKFLISPATPAPLPPVVLDPATTFLIPTDFVTGGTLVSRKTITVDGYNENPNYAVTYVSGGQLEVIIPNAATLAAREAAAIAESKAHLEVTSSALTHSATFKMPEQLKSSAMQPYLEQAAQALMRQLISAGDTATLDLYFKDGVASFLNGFKDDPTRQMMLMGTLSEVVLKYAKLPADQQPPELADIIYAATVKAKQAKVEQAKEVVRLYDEWLAGPDPSVPQIVNPGDLNLVPNFAKQVKVNYAKDAAIAVGASLGAGATVAGVMAALPVSFITSAVGTGTMTSLIGAAGLSLMGSAAGGAGAAAGTAAGTVAATGASTATLGGGYVGIAIAGPVIVTVLAAAVVTVAAIQLSKQPEIKASIAAAQSTAVTEISEIALNLNDTDDQGAFASGFMRFMSGGAF